VAAVENTQLYKNIGREGEWATWVINREERGKVCRDQVGRPGEQIAEIRLEQESCWGVRQGYQVSIVPVALGCGVCIVLCGLVDLASCSGGFLREQIRGFEE
jgi:hypothetical protein